MNRKNHKGGQGMREKLSKGTGRRMLTALAAALFMCLALGGATEVKAATEKLVSGSYTYEAKHNSNYTKTTLYKQKKGGVKKKIATVSGCAYLNFVYGNNLYFEMDRKNDSMTIDFWALNLKTNKTKKVRTNATVISNSGKYVVLRPNSGAVMGLPTTLYNLSSGKASLLSKECINAAISGKRVYYGVVFENGSRFKVKIYSKNLSGGDKKAVSKYLNVDYIQKLTSKYAVYHSGGYDYKYTYATGKSTRV